MTSQDVHNAALSEEDGSVNSERVSAMLFDTLRVDVAGETQYVDVWQLGAIIDACST